MHPTSHRPAASPPNGSTTMSMPDGQAGGRQPTRYGILLALAAASIQAFFAAKSLKASRGPARSGEKVPS